MGDIPQKHFAGNDEAGITEKYVTFAIGEENYGVDVRRVHEIIGMSRITHVPNSMAFMKGVINLRGNVVPVIDMRIKFNLMFKEYNDQTVIIIIEIQGKLVGMIVDTVSDVVGMEAGKIQNTPHFSAGIDTDFIGGIGNNGDNLLIILNVDKILSSQEIEMIDEKKTA